MTRRALLARTVEFNLYTTDSKGQLVPRALVRYWSMLRLSRMASFASAFASAALQKSGGIFRCIGASHGIDNAFDTAFAHPESAQSLLCHSFVAVVFIGKVVGRVAVTYHLLQGREPLSPVSPEPCSSRQRISTVLKISDKVR